VPNKITVSWDDLEAAFVIGSPDAHYFLHAQTGELIYLSPMDDESTRERILKKVEEPGWLEIPRASTPEGMVEVEAFIAAEPDESYRAELTACLSERIPFRAFMMVLATNPSARDRWSEWREEGIQKRVQDFCRTHDLEIDDERFYKGSE
jgi:hypothetical protein